MTEIRPRFRSLTGRERQVAEDLHARMCELLAEDDQLTMAEAVGIAAIEGGYEPITKPQPPGLPEPP